VNNLSDKMSTHSLFLFCIFQRCVCNYVCMFVCVCVCILTVQKLSYLLMGPTSYMWPIVDRKVVMRHTTVQRQPSVSIAKKAGLVVEMMRTSCKREKSV